MADTIREKVLAAFFAKLQAISTVYGLTVERNRDTAVEKCPALVLIDGVDQTDDSFATGITRHLMTITVEGYVKAEEEGQDRMKLADQLHGEMMKAALADYTLGGLTVDLIAQGDTPATDPADGHPYGAAFSADFQTEFWTKQGDPYTAGP